MRGWQVLPGQAPAETSDQGQAPNRFRRCQGRAEALSRAHAWRWCSQGRAAAHLVEAQPTLLQHSGRFAHIHMQVPSCAQCSVCLLHRTLCLLRRREESKWRRRSLAECRLSADRTDLEEGEAYAPLFVECSGCKCCVTIQPEHHDQMVALSSYHLQHGCTLPTSTTSCWSPLHQWS